MIVKLTVFTLLYVLTFSEASLSWLSIAKMRNFNLTSPEQCDRLYGWTLAQRRFCQNHFQYMNAIRRGAIMTLEECQSQFKNRRWNCSSLNTPNLFARLPDFGLREAAYLYSLASAALTYSITQACSDGRISGCSCDMNYQGVTNDGNRWSGCSDNVQYGMAIAEKFLDPRVRNRTNVLLMNIHNSEVGRVLLGNNMQNQCKCHGVSGSCEIKTCFRSMPQFKQISSILKEKYDAAVEVRVRRTRYSRKLVARNRIYKNLSKTDLVFLYKSPDFCEPYLKLAAFGTRNRICNKHSRGIDGCDLMCCGRPYKTTIERVRFKCNCTFTWCCSVQCQECQKIVTVTRCT